MIKNVICTGIFFLSLAGAAVYGQEPVDLAALREAGLKNETLGRFLAQNLNGSRAAPQVDANLLSRLAAYGGDDLAAAYLELDRATANLPARDFSPEVVGQLMASRVAPENLSQLLSAEAARYQAPSAGSGDTVKPSVKAEPIMAPPLPPARTTKVEIPAAPAAPAHQILPPASPKRPETAYQDLRPGQAADPGSRLPLPYDTYDIRRQKADGPWMGVTERELPDGHIYEVNSIGTAKLVGLEVLSRPTGHKVYRYYTGNPDNPRAITYSTEPEQAQRSREDLEIILSDKNSRYYQ